MLILSDYYCLLLGLLQLVSQLAGHGNIDNLQSRKPSLILYIYSCVWLENMFLFRV